jgi:hypothetical protein
MGFIPIFLYLASFIFLFVMVVFNSIKNKKKLYLKALENLVARLKEVEDGLQGQKIPLEELSLPEIENYFWTLKSGSDSQKQEILNQKIKPSLSQAKLHLYWYNNLIKTKPYSFVAKIMGYSPI